MPREREVLNFGEVVVKRAQECFWLWLIFIFLLVQVINCLIVNINSSLDVTTGLFH